uniref:Putative secreted protein n=1 Tax=Ixodes ricinus TaxID=34613 RepID=A0A6B0TZ07_IXORI
MLSRITKFLSWTVHSIARSIGVLGFPTACTSGQYVDSLPTAYTPAVFVSPEATNSSLLFWQHELGC